MNMKVVQYTIDFSLRLLERFEITSYPLGREGSILLFVPALPVSHSIQLTNCSLMVYNVIKQTVQHHANKINNNIYKKTDILFI